MKVLGTLKQGDTFKVDIVLKVDGLPYDLTGATIVSSVETEDASFTMAIPVTVTDAAGGAFTVEEQTTTWPLGNVLWDVRLTNGTFSWSLPSAAVGIEERIS